MPGRATSASATSSRSRRASRTSSSCAPTSRCGRGAPTTRASSATGGTAPAAAPVRVTNLANVRSIAAGADFSVAVREDGQAFAWGLAPSFASFKATPTRVSGLDGARSSSASSHVLSLDQAGRGTAWGRGLQGRRARSSVPGTRAAHGRHEGARRGRQSLARHHRRRPRRRLGPQLPAAARGAARAGAADIRRGQRPGQFRVHARRVAGRGVPQSGHRDGGQDEPHRTTS